MGGRLTLVPDFQDAPRQFSQDSTANPLVSVALANVIAPFQISVPKSVQGDAFEELTIEMGLGPAPLQIEDADVEEG